MRAVLPLSLLLCLGVFAACGGTPIEAGQVESRDVQLLREDGGTPYITGKLVNLSGTTIPSVQVQVVFYDAENTKVDEMVFPVRDLTPGTEVAFKHSIDTNVEIARAAITGILRL